MNAGVEAAVKAIELWMGRQANGTELRNVIGADAIEDARRRGRIVFEVLPNDSIVTALASETAERLGIKNWLMDLLKSLLPRAQMGR